MRHAGTLYSLSCYECARGHGIAEARRRACPSSLSPVGWLLSSQGSPASPPCHSTRTPCKSSARYSPSIRPHAYIHPTSPRYAMRTRTRRMKCCGRWRPPGCHHADPLCMLHTSSSRHPRLRTGLAPPFSAPLPLCSQLGSYNHLSELTAHLNSSSRQAYSTTKT